jgi:hypothetical protein
MIKDKLLFKYELQNSNISRENHWCSIFTDQLYKMEDNNDVYLNRLQNFMYCGVAP